MIDYLSVGNILKSLSLKILVIVDLNEKLFILSCTGSTEITLTPNKNNLLKAHEDVWACTII